MPKPDAKAQAMLDKMLMMDLIVIRSLPANDLDKLFEMLAEHLEFIISLEEQGKLFASGQTFDAEMKGDGSGLTILKNVTLEEAQKIWAGEPFYKNNIRGAEFYPWRMAEGGLTMTLKLSSGSFEAS